MLKRSLAIILALLVFIGGFLLLTRSVKPALPDLEPSAEKNRIAYLPLDDRPDNADRVIYLAQSLGYELKMPDADLYRTRLNGQPLNENGTQYGDRAKLYEWLVSQENEGCDRYIISLDQLLSGGLVSSRAMTGTEKIVLSDGETVSDTELLEMLVDTLSSDKNNCVWLLDTVMRLAPTVGYMEWTGEEYNAMRAYGAEARPELTGADLSVENIINNYKLGSDGIELPLPDGMETRQLAEYLSSRERKLRLSDRLLRLMDRDSAGIFRVLTGIDDSSEEFSIQRSEIAYLRGGLRDCDALLSGVDDMAFKAVARLYLDEIGWDGAEVKVQYFGGTEDRPACEYDYSPLVDIMHEHEEFFGLTESDSAELQVIVLTQPEDEGKLKSYKNGLISAVKESLADNKPTVLIDASNFSYGETVHDALTREVDLGSLVSYAGYLDMAIVSGTALSHGVARYAYLRQGETDTEAERAFMKSLADSLIIDLCFRTKVRNVIAAKVREDGGSTDNFCVPEMDIASLEKLLGEKMAKESGKVIKNLENSPVVSALSPSGVMKWGSIEIRDCRFPWSRVFEMAMEIEPSLPEAARAK